MAGSHGEDARVLLDDDEPTVFVNNLHVLALETLLVALAAAHGHFRAGMQGIVELGDGLAVHLDAAALKGGFHLVAAFVKMAQQKLQQTVVAVGHKVQVVVGLVGLVSHIKLVLGEIS